MDLSADFKWLRSHILLLILTAALVYGAVYYVDYLISKHDDAANTKWQQILTSQAQQTQSLQTALQSQQALAKSQSDAAFAAITQLSNSIQARDAQTQTQIQKDSSLSALEVSQRLTQQTGAAANEITASTDNISLDLPVAHKVVQSLDTLPGLQADLSDTQKELAAQKQATVSLSATASTAQELISSLNTQLTDASKACQAEVTKVKADARKSKLRWFGAGFVFGVFAKRIFLGSF